MIIFVLLIIEIICTINYYLKGFFSIKIYIFDISNKYINYITPPQKNQKCSIKKILLNDNNNKNHLLTDNNFMKINQQIINENQNQQNIKVIKPKTKDKRLILRRHLIFLNNNKGQSKENNKINVNSNLISEHLVNSKETNKEMIDSCEEKNRKIYKAKDIQIFNKPNKIEKPSIINNKILYKNIDINISDGGCVNSNSDLKSNTIKHDEFFEDYLQTEFDDMEYDDLIEKDKRKFCEYFKEKIIENQSIVNTFCCEEPFKPKSIKILLLVLQIDLYLFINGLFYDEEYASEIFHLEKDTFFDMLGRFFGNLVYAALVGIIISYIIECFFIEESRLKKILKKRKGDINILKEEINIIVNGIKKRYIFFIIITFLITIFTWIHISCFNIVYPHLMWEWLLFSAIIIVFMQIFSAFICLLQTIIRFLSFKCKSEKIYKISYLLS